MVSFTNLISSNKINGSDQLSKSPGENGVGIQSDAHWFDVMLVNIVTGQSCLCARFTLYASFPVKVLGMFV